MAPVFCRLLPRRKRRSFAASKDRSLLFAGAIASRPATSMLPLRADTLTLAGYRPTMSVWSLVSVMPLTSLVVFSVSFPATNSDWLTRRTLPPVDTRLTALRSV
ncbi:hypothetical protein D3C72_952710 [compost metagenome]